MTSSVVSVLLFMTAVVEAVLVSMFYPCSEDALGHKIIDEELV